MISKPLLSWWQESGWRERESDSATQLIGVTAQQILAELVEGESVVVAQPSCTDCGRGESSLSYPSAVVSQTQSRAAAESRGLPAEQYSGDIH